MEELYPKVVQAIPGKDYAVYAYMNDGGVRLLDMRSFVEQGGVFEPLRDRSFFVDRLSIIGDTVAWDMTGDKDPYKCVDIDPCTIQDLPLVDDPLAAEAGGESDG